jgi:hypothetical protein
VNKAAECIGGHQTQQPEDNKASCDDFKHFRISMSPSIVGKMIKDNPVEKYAG